MTTGSRGREGRQVVPASSGGGSGGVGLCWPRSAAVDFIDAGCPFRLARHVFTVRDEFDPRDHVPGGWRCEPWLRPLLGGPGAFALGGVTAGALVGVTLQSVGGLLPVSVLRGAAVVVAAVLLLRPVLFNSFDRLRVAGWSRELEPVREAGPFTPVRGRVGNGVRDAGRDGNRIPRGPARGCRGDIAPSGRYLRSLRSRSRGSADCSRPVSVATAATHTRLPGLAGLVEAHTDVCARIVTSFLVGIVIQYWNLTPFE